MRYNTIITADGFDTLFSEKYNQTYHSVHGVLQESQHVFLDGAGVEARLKSKKETAVLEIGFGAGFNFFLTASKAIAYGARLEFTSVENDFLNYEIYSSLNYSQLPHIQSLYARFLDWCKNRPRQIPDGAYKIDLNVSRPKSNLPRLNLLLGNALDISLPANTFHAIYLDAFSPDDNPELWTVSFFRKLFQAIKPGAVLSTYSAKGHVRRALKEAGFEVSKRTGPLGKREMLVAKKV